MRFQHATTPGSTPYYVFLWCEKPEDADRWTWRDGKATAKQLLTGTWK